MFFIIGILMFLSMILFIIYALKHPEGSSGFNLSTTYILYFIYIVIMIGMFIISSINRNK